MENSEEPQKKVFKARKTMRASDRQQLESVYKVKEDFLKTADLKLLNGKHENGDSDISSPLLNSDCIEGSEVNGLEDVCLDPEDNKVESDEITDVKSPDNKDNQHDDLTTKFEALSPENIVSEQHHENSSPPLSPGSESQVLECNKDSDIREQITIKEDLNYKDLCVPDNLDQKSSSSHTEEESNINDQMVEPAETNELAITPELSMEEKNNADETVVKEDVDEEAISSSLNTAEGSKNEIKSAEVVETMAQKTVEEPPTENMLGSAARMETDEIIPILEKLAPANALNCFSQPTLLPVETPSLCSEEKVANSLNSPSKHESNESLPKEAFLVLSDEEEVCCEKEAVVLMPKHENPPEDSEEKKELNHIEEREPNKEEEKPPEKCEASRRKRSKSEDMDSIHSKRRRYLGDFEAEFEVKITTKGDVHQKLEKVIHRFLEEKFSAMECALFDKTLEDLKSRIDKIECNKRHKTVITELQAKIARLTKRFGAAREDSKKKPEILQNTAHSPGKAVSDTGSVNSVTFRNSGTVRQMLETKRNVGDTSSTTFQSPVNTVSAASLATPQIPVSGHPKPQTPVTSASLTSGSLTTSVLPTANTATVVGTSQVAGGNTQPMSVSLQSLPVILHVPVAMSSQPQLLQGHTGTLVTNQQSGSVEFIPVQSQSNVGNLTKTSLSLSSINSAKPNNPSVSSSSIQRNSPASVGCSIGTTLAVQAVTTAHPVAQATRTALATVNTSGIYTPPINRNAIQMKIPISAFNTSAPSEVNTTTPRIDGKKQNQNQSNNSGMGLSVPAIARPLHQTFFQILFLYWLYIPTDGKKQNQNQSNNSGMGLSVPAIARPLHQVQTTPLQQAGLPTSGLSQATIHVLPTAQTTVNVTHRPVTQATARLPVPRAPANHQVVYTTLPAPSGQTPVRTTVMQNSGLRQITPQNSGVTVRVPQTTAYVVNSGLTLGSGGPQLTVHHRPPPVHSEPLRPVHPAPLPEAQQPSRLPPEAANHSLPQKPHLKLARVQSQNGIVLSWSVLEVDRSCASVDSYHLYAYHEDPSATVPSQWKKIGEVKALPLPMACTLTQFVSGSKYYFAVRAKDIYGRFGPFCDPQSTDVIASQSS
ncbi:PREDICTED: activating transcription factor 7-interacting protein 1 [Thamnophis sirtalis]|uniref:Activating transcription factor 7-interacting protein 1 n=1 Tax=Thamnophis sirtalis TaxID=35019 RepID=A0A6I9X7M8_9SAUR|nr:PREDICTED: activating transcription factor 7-interacting protein 1 [Thamnophis sirtalis]